MELIENIRDMVARRLEADRETVSNLLVGHMLGQQAQNLDLAFGQSGKLVTGRSFGKEQSS